MENNKIICEDCEIEYDENQYYLSRIEGQKRMPICKHCFERELTNSGSIEVTFKKYNIPFITKLWDEIGKSYNGSEALPRYMKTLCLPKYINLRWKDTDWNNKETIEEPSFYEEIVKNLKSEANKLSDKIRKLSDKNDMNLYIACIKSLRETLDLISKYDWKLMYSEYGYTQDQKQIAVWEQNHDNQIRNHKIWNIVK